MLDFGKGTAMNTMICRKPGETSVDIDRLAKLKSELVAIELWDSDYYQHPELHDKITIDAYRCIQVRRHELLAKILCILEPSRFRI